MDPDRFAMLIRSEARAIEAGYPYAPVKRIRVGKQRDDAQRQRTHNARYEPGHRRIDIYQTPQEETREVLKTFYHEYGHHLHHMADEDGDPLGVVPEDIIEFYEEKGYEMTLENTQWQEEVAMSFANQRINERWPGVMAAHRLNNDDELRLTSFVESITLD